MPTECETLATSVGEMFSCTEHPGGFVRVRTPFLYPDGDIIDVFAKRTGDVTMVTDLGETLRWLRTQNVSGRRSQKQRQILADVCLNHNVELYRGMLTARAEGPREFAPAVLKVAQAALRAADLWFTFRTRAFESIVDEVSEFFDERKFKVTVHALRSAVTPRAGATGAGGDAAPPRRPPSGSRVRDGAAA